MYEGRMHVPLVHCALSHPIHRAQLLFHHLPPVLADLDLDLELDLELDLGLVAAVQSEWVNGQGGRVPCMQQSSTTMLVQPTTCVVLQTIPLHTCVY